jgi:hypothetical protein
MVKEEIMSARAKIMTFSTLVRTIITERRATSLADEIPGSTCRVVK